MAGSNQSVNLQGMLGGIGQTLGEMGAGGKQMIAAGMKPQGDMNDPEHLMRLSQWASQNGDTAAAGMYMSQARQVSSERKAAAEEKRRLAAQTSANATTATYKKALESGDEEAIAKAEEIMQAGAAQYGYDAQTRMNAASQAVKAANDQAWSEAERVRVEKERAASQKVAVELNGAESAEDIQAIVEKAPPEFADQVQRMATARMSYLTAVEERAAKAANNAADVDVTFKVPAGLPEKVRASLEAEAARIAEDKKNHTNSDGTWKTAVGRRTIDNAMTALLNKAFQAEMGLAVNEESDRRQRLRTIDHKRTQVAISNPTKEQIKQYEDMMIEESRVEDTFLWFDKTAKPTYQQIVERFRADQRAALDAEAASIMGVEPPMAEGAAEGGPKVGDVRDGYRYKGGDPASPNSWEPVA